MFVQCLIKYVLFHPFNIAVALNHYDFILLVLASLCIAAAGNIFNDINDLETDRINKPNSVIVEQSISEKNAFNLFIILNIVGVGLGFYLSSRIGKSNLFIIFVLASVLLYMYSTFFKRIAILGNIVIAALVALSIIIVAIFDLLPAMTFQNKATQTTMFNIVLDYATFAFAINFIREIVKDIEDVDGDFNLGIKTLPILIGRCRASKFVFLLCLIFIILILLYLIQYLYKQQWLLIYFLVLVVAPLIYVAIKAYNAEQKTDFSHLSKWLKLIMLFGICSLLLYPFVLK